MIYIFIGLIFIVFLYLIILTVFKKAQKATLKRIKIDENEKIILQDNSANFFGILSKGKGQLRGNCVLILTDKNLYSFLYLSPKQDIKIPLENIIEITKVKSFLQKSIFRELVKITFINNGKEDKIAWYVKNPDTWIKAIGSI